MTRAVKTSTPSSIAPKGNVLALRGHRFHASGCPPALKNGRLESLAAAFLADPTPGLIFEYGQLVLANDAARTLLEIAAAEEFLERLRASLNSGSLEPGLALQTRFGAYVPALQSARAHGRHPTVVCFLLRQRGVDPVLESLTERERGVVTLLVKGLTNGEIANELGISVETVRKHVSSALEKTGTRTRAGLVGRTLER